MGDKSGRTTFDRFIAATMALAALCVVALFARRELQSNRSRSQPVDPPAAYVEEWRTLLAEGIRIGPADALLEIVEFGDFECPFCRRFAAEVRKLRTEYGEHVALTYIHFPLRSHRFARVAAHVAECAAEQDRFEVMHDLLFERQDSIGLKEWDAFGRDAEIPDLARFNACRSNTELPDRIARGRHVGDSIGVRGTPTVILNGWRMRQPPDADAMRDSVLVVIQRQTPANDR